MLFISNENDLAELIISFIREAKHELLLCVYLLSLPIIITEIIKRKSEGVVVKVILAADPLNNYTLKFLEANGVEVRTIYQTYGRLHAKFIIADDRALITTCNYTHDGVNNNLEIAYLLENRDDVKRLKVFFNQLWNYYYE